MNEQPKISIITACYNSEKTIEQTIQSVVNQTYENIQYIIVDGASTDGTMEIVEKYRDQIDVVVSEKDDGIYDAFNKGISKSNGEIIYFLNSDDTLSDFFVIEDVTQEFNNQKLAMIIYGNVEYVDDINGKIHLLKKEFNLELLKKGCMPHHQSTFYKRIVFEKYGMYSNKYKLAADFEFTARFFENEFKHIFYYNRNIAKFRCGGLSTMPAYNQTSWMDETSKVIKEVFDIECAKNPFESNFQLLKMWLELSIKNILITSDIKENENIAIFGSGDIAVYIIEELYKIKVIPKIILDNDSFKHGKIFKDIEIHSPDSLLTVKVDLIILTAEANYDDEIKNQLKSFLGVSYENIKVVSWKQLVINSYKQLPILKTCD